MKFEEFSCSCGAIAAVAPHAAFLHPWVPNCPGCENDMRKSSWFEILRRRLVDAWAVLCGRKIALTLTVPGAVGITAENRYDLVRKL